MCYYINNDRLYNTVAHFPIYQIKLITQAERQWALYNGSFMAAVIKLVNHGEARTAVYMFLPTPLFFPESFTSLYTTYLHRVN